MSFQKYVSRLKDQDIKIPGSMIEKIQEYLDKG